jgi:hypothetical protein
MRLTVALLLVAGLAQAQAPTAPPTCGVPTPKVCDAAHSFVIFSQEEPTPVHHWLVIVANGTPPATIDRAHVTPNPTPTPPDYYETALSGVGIGAFCLLACPIDGYCSDPSNAQVCITPTPTLTATPTPTATSTPSPTRTKHRPPHVHDWKW